MPESTAENLAKAVQGDIAALSELLAEFGPPLRDQLSIDARWRRVLDADDVMQVTYLDAFLNIQAFSPETAGTFAAWLRRIAENNLRDAVRGLEAAKRLPPGAAQCAGGAPKNLLEALAASRDSPSRIAAAGEQRRLLEEMLERLPEDYAVAVRLYDIDGQPIEAVAQAMQRSPGAIHMLRARAHERLRELLGPVSDFFPARA